MCWAIVFISSVWHFMTMFWSSVNWNFAAIEQPTAYGIPVWQSARKNWWYDFKPTKEVPVYHTSALPSHFEPGWGYFWMEKVVSSPLQKSACRSGGSRKRYPDPKCNPKNINTIKTNIYIWICQLHEVIQYHMIPSGWFNMRLKTGRKLPV